MLFDSQAADAVDKSLIEWIYNQDNYERLQQYSENEDYYEGDLDIELPGNISAMLAGKFGFTGNVCRAVVDAGVGFLSQEPLAIEVEAPDEELADSAGEVEQFLYEVFRDSDLLVRNYIKALRIQGKKGEFALKVLPVLDDNEEEIIGYKISVLRPDICFPKWADEEYSEMEYFAIKYIRDNPDTGEKEQFAQVLFPNEVREYSKPLNASDITGWSKIDEWQTDYGFIPVEWVKNKEDDKPWSESDITPDLKDLQDAFNKSITDLIYNMDKDSYKEKFVLGGGPPLDKKGNPVNIESGPGKVHFLSANMDGVVPSMWESAPSNFQGLLDSMDRLLDIVSVVSRVPKLELSRDHGMGAAPSGVALRIIYQPFIGKINEKANLVKSALEKCAQKTLYMAETDGVDIGFEPGDYIPVIHIRYGLPVDEKEVAEIHELENRMRWKSRDSIMQERGIEDIEAEKEKIAEEEQDAALYGEGDRIDEELAGIDLDIGEEI
ncbi:phage portal protein [Halarsenatibacter silvermanii]|uniref:Phage portal protein, SPP1 Gp6-like n=1 Tax=Halarsenatibacter silvermanii TaxID=321763 RepID=A0A1G9RAR4_9FIRM|nr:phage portal protein [Halarsenatibacter silvermanii]SDM20314.1 Phage portal protein, SPP1 Gp6-like [Halarsenatibacter silvermanii]